MTAVRGPGRPRSESIDAAILNATLDELIERGFLAATMESIATRAGVAKTTVYRRWPSITDLAVAAMRTFDAEAEQPEGETVRDQLLCLMDRMRRKWGDPRYAAVMRRVAADGTVQPDTYRDARDRLITPHVRILNGVLRRGITEGLIRPDVDVDVVRQLLTAPVMAAALALRDRVTHAQVEFMVDTVLAGIAPRAE